MPTATTSSVNNNSTKLFIHKLRQRFQKATNFFLQKMEDIDHILGKKEDLKLSDNKFIEINQRINCSCSFVYMSITIFYELKFI